LYKSRIHSNWAGDPDRKKSLVLSDWDMVVIKLPFLSVFV
jgi:hypothetical protein